MRNSHGIRPRADSSDTIALVLETVFGIFGLLGIGWLYTGNIFMAVIVFIGFLMLVSLEFVVGVLTAGMAGCFFFPLNIAVAVISGVKAQNYMRRSMAKGSILYVVLGLTVGVVLVCGGLGAIATFLGVLGSIA